MRAPNGTGTITKLQGSRRKPYMVRLPGRKGPENKLIRPILGYYKEYNEALIALAAYNQAPIENINIKLEQLWEEWKKTRAYTELTSATKNNYNAAWSKRIHILGPFKVKDIRTAHLQAVIDTAQSEGMSHSSLSKDKALMTLLFSYAVQNDIIIKNYAQFVKLPSNDEISTKDSFSDVELQKIEKAAKDGVPFADVVLILCYTGFRIQELLNFTAFAYDPENKCLNGGLKTSSGKNRTVPIHPKIQQYVETWISKRGERIISKENGKPYNQKYFRENCYMPALEKIGIDEERRLLPHCCRHTFATLMYRKGIGDKEREMLMGHTNIEMTMKYTHTDLAALKNAINAL